MTTHAKIKLVPASAKETITLEEIKDLLSYYKEITSKTGNQVNWDYGEAALPYEMQIRESEKGNYLYLSSKHDRYHAIQVGIEKEVVELSDGSEQDLTVVQIALAPSSTYGDKGKANEFCKFLAKKLQGELHLFNGRIMYYYIRK